MNYKQMNLDQLEIERLNVRERIIPATGIAIMIIILIFSTIVVAISSRGERNHGKQ